MTDSKEEPMPVAVRVESLSLDPNSRTPILTLKEEDGERSFQVYIGLMEAGSIATALEGVVGPRPMTHDLLVHLVEDLEARLLQVEITDIRDGTYFGALVLDQQDRTVVVDCRPSDAIAMAVRVGVDILVHAKVFEKASPITDQDNAGRGEDEIWKEILEEMEEDDFGKYKM
ncbi:MAG: bifunctional nuclease family protein [Pseudomonadota bacterium]